MPLRHCIRAALLLLASTRALSAQEVPAPATAEATFRVFARGAVLGAEQSAVTRDAAGWTITSSGRLNAPLNIVNRRLQIKYDLDWKPIEMTFDTTVRGQVQTIHTTLKGDMATSDVTLGSQSRVITA